MPLTSSSPGPSSDHHHRQPLKKSFLMFVVIHVGARAEAKRDGTGAARPKRQVEQSSCQHEKNGTRPYDEIIGNSANALSI